MGGLAAIYLLYSYNNKSEDTGEEVNDLFSIENLKLDINFNGSGLAIIKKTKDNLNNETKIKNRSLSLKNIIKKIYSPKPKN